MALKLYESFAVWVKALKKFPSLFFYYFVLSIILNLQSVKLFLLEMTRKLWGKYKNFRTFVSMTNRSPKQRFFCYFELINMAAWNVDPLRHLIRNWLQILCGKSFNKQQVVSTATIKPTFETVWNTTRLNILVTNGALLPVLASHLES